MKATELTPKTIEVGFYYKQKPFYVLHFMDWSFEEMSLNGILTFIENLEPEELKSCSISFWDKEGLGMKRVWNCDGEYFLKNHKLKQLDKQPTR
ncbi:hypothetical protein VPGG_00052 [Vibrio phage VBM1]|uniref:hypothetical protein n=1 Tax=Vibrio phage VBM1 TaxID=754074 RepID=UPI0002C0E4AF|nr:hypothetical protein VPGG_00052 [Vibrio phage VBM1]AGH07369.1 hypothetical protein VPGG_00052 [Vibrio phage VBM1]